jgi:hypothetical protein
MNDPQIGTVAVLNVGEGDLTLTFDKSKPAERERAKKIITDMLARGYAILVQVGEHDGEPVYQRAKGFDPETCEYLIVGVAEDEARVTTEGNVIVPEVVEAELAPDIPPPAPLKRGRPRKLTTERIPAEKTRTVAVARTAGG